MYTRFDSLEPKSFVPHTQGISPQFIQMDMNDPQEDIYFNFETSHKSPVVLMPKSQNENNIDWSKLAPTTQPAEFGPHYWFVIHNMGLTYPMRPNRVAKKRMSAFIEALPVLLPCKDCSEHAKEYLSQHSVCDAVKSRESLYTFLWNFHNHVNERLGKRQMSLKDSLKIYNRGNSAYL